MPGTKSVVCKQPGCKKSVHHLCFDSEWRSKLPDVEPPEGGATDCYCPAHIPWPKDAEDEAEEQAEEQAVGGRGRSGRGGRGGRNGRGGRGGRGGAGRGKRGRGGDEEVEV